MEHVGKGTVEDAQTPLKENLNGYPENRMYGKTNPAYGLYVRHAKNIIVDNFQVRLQNVDARPAVVMEDVQDVLIDKLKDTSAQKQELWCVWQIAEMYYFGIPIQVQPLPLHS